MTVGDRGSEGITPNGPRAAVRPPARPGSTGTLPPGWVRVDCHLHTARSGDAVTTLEQLADRVERTGLDVVCITDHHAIDAATEALGRDLGVRVVVGEEIRTPVGELIGLFLTERIPYVLPVDEVVARIKEQGGVVYAPHPFDPVRAGVRETVLRRLCESGQLDVVEAFNAKIEDDDHNLAAGRVARDYGLPVAAGSDAHDPPGVGAAWVEMPDFDGPDEFIRALSNGQLVGEYRPHALRFTPVQQVG
jgi:predicted metal-dependent phosphoesterase TrpH